MSHSTCPHGHAVSAMFQDRAHVAVATSRRRTHVARTCAAATSMRASSRLAAVVAARPAPPVTLAHDDLASRPRTSLLALPGVSARPRLRAPPRSFPASSRRRRRVRVGRKRALTPRTRRSRSARHALGGADLGPSCGPPRVPESPRPVAQGRRPVAFAVRGPRRLALGADLAAIDEAALGRSPRSPPAVEQGPNARSAASPATRPRRPRRPPARALRGCFFPPGACGTDLGQHVRPQQMVHD